MVVQPKQRTQPLGVWPAGHVSTTRVFLRCRVGTICHMVPETNTLPRRVLSWRKCPVLASRGCSNRQLQPGRLRTWGMSSLPVLEAVGLKLASLCRNEGVCRAVLLPEAPGKDTSGLFSLPWLQAAPRTRLLLCVPFGQNARARIWGPPENPGQSRTTSHLKTLHLISFAKAFIPNKATLRVPGAGNSYLWGLHSASKTFKLPDRFSVREH